MEYDDCMDPFAQLRIACVCLAEKVGFQHPPTKLNEIYHFDNWWEAGPNQAICKFTGILHPPGE